jgi:hypothetical protein
MDPVLLPALLIDGWALLLTGLLLYQGLSSALTGLRARRLLGAVALGLILVSVPTLFTVFPTTGNWRPGIRVLIVGAWLVSALLAVYVTATSDEYVRSAVDESHHDVEDMQGRSIKAERRSVIAEQFKEALAPGANGLPEQYRVSVYSPPVGKFLVPVFPPVPSFADPAIFAVGTGATGKAWEDPDQRDFVATGPAVSDVSHGLTQVQQRRYAMYRSVAATRILGLEDEPIGVLSVLGVQEDGFFDTDEGLKALRMLSDAISWLMPEATQWMLPER